MHGKKSAASYRSITRNTAVPFFPKYSYSGCPMKKYRTITLAAMTILAMLFSLIPMSSALARRNDTQVTIKIRNRTGGTVQVRLSAENGKSLFFEVGPGQTNTVVFEGRFQYFASSPCGNQGGVFNMNVTKELFFSCVAAGLEVKLIVPGMEMCMAGMPGMPGHTGYHCHIM
jgi:hypothetical protein